MLALLLEAECVNCDKCVLASLSELSLHTTGQAQAALAAGRAAGLTSLLVTHHGPVSLSPLSMSNTAGK